MSKKQKANIHFSIGAKGGISKSFIAALIAEFLLEKNNTVKVYDTDPNNHTISDIETLPNVTFLNILGDGNDIKISKFDDLVLHLLQENKEMHDVVVDIGATTFSPIYSYIVENSTFELLASTYNIFIHIPVVGGEAMMDTLNGMDQMIEAFQDSCTYIVWSNPHFGELKTAEGKTFEELPEYIKHKEKIFGLIRMPQRSSLFDEAIEKLKKSKKLFRDVDMDETFNILEKSRLSMTKNDYFSMMSMVIPTDNKNSKKENK